MHILRTTVTAAIVVAIASCSGLKKNTSSSGEKTASDRPAKKSKSSDGIYAPGNDELAAIQNKYEGTNLQTLTDGYKIFTSVCTSCHPAKNIYKRTEQSWPGIINAMAQKAALTSVQKDAVLRYVMSVKAVQKK
jgi:mono/diheme cytochrome c family protein